MASDEEWSSFSNINFDYQIRVTPHIGKGSIGDVYGPCLWKHSSFAFKRILAIGPDDSESLSTMVESRSKEIFKVWSSIDHRNLIKIWYASLHPPLLYIVMEYAGGGTLTKALRSLSSLLPYSAVIDWAEQIATGMSYLHERSFIHGNLKSGNIMVLENFDQNCIRDLTLKITDFHQMQWKNVKTTEGFAPEVIGTLNYSKASDIWRPSYGVVLWEILTRQSVCKVQALNFKLENLDSCLSVFMELFEGCFEQMQEKRPMFSEIISVLLDMRQDRDVIEMLLAERNTDNYKRFLPEGLMTAPSVQLTHESKSEEENRTAESKPIKKPDTDTVDYKMKLKQQAENDASVTRALLTKSQPSIYGLATLKDEVFVSHLQSPVIVVYNSLTFNCKRRLTVSGLTNPEHIVSCNVYQCLYSFDWSYQGRFCEILRIDPHIGKVVKNWKMLEGGGRLSVAKDTNIILNVNSRAQLNEYTADGELLRRINLASGTGIVKAWHAIKLDSGMFIVCHGDYDDPKSRVCLMSVKENKGLFGESFDTEVLLAFGDECGGLLKCPMYLAVDKEGAVLVCDGRSRRLLLLNSCLEERRQLIPAENITMLPWRVCVDEINNRYLVADYDRIVFCKILSDGEPTWQTFLG